MNDDKRMIRMAAMRERRALSDVSVRDMSLAVSSFVLELVGQICPATVHTYLPIIGKNEVDASLCIRAFAHFYPDITVASWKDFRAGMESVWLNGPMCGESIVGNMQFSLILVPLLAFNNNGHRIGYGSGFYDRFLKSQRGALTVGLAYEMSRHGFTAKPHDVPLDYIVTELAVYRFMQDN